MRELAQQQFGYDKIAAAGIKVAIATATAIDAQARSVTLSTGDTLAYDRLVLAPGIELRFDGIKGYSEAAAQQAPHAWTADAAQYELLRQQIVAMADDGVVAIVAPANPSRCPPGPYERASMIAHYLKTNKPKAKIVILDAKDTFTMQPLFLDAWQKLYPDMIAWKSLSNGGNVASIDVAKKSIETDFDTYEYAVANVIPPQKAGRIAGLAGVVDRTGWCPVDAVTFESQKQKDIHVIGDSAFAGTMPKSAFSGLTRRQALRRRDRAPLRRRHAGGGRRCRAIATASSRPATPSRSPANSARSTASTPKSTTRSTPARSMRRRRCAPRTPRKPMPGSAPRPQRFLVEDDR